MKNRSKERFFYSFILWKELLDIGLITLNYHLPLMFSDKVYYDCATIKRLIKIKLNSFVKIL